MKANPSSEKPVNGDLKRFKELATKLFRLPPDEVEKVKDKIPAEKTSNSKNKKRK